VNSLSVTVVPDSGSDELAGLDEQSRLRQDLELDSLDFLRLVEMIDEATGVDIPESDYTAVSTVRGLIDYVASRA